MQRSDKEALEYVGVKEEKDIKKMKTSDPELDRKSVISCARISLTYVPLAPL